MKRVIIWPDIYKEQGHWLPCVSLAQTLITAGYKVEFMGIPDCESILKPYVPDGQMADYFHPILESIYPIGYSVENKLEPIDMRWKPHHLLPICRGALDPIFRAYNQVDLLISGYFTGLETLLIHHKYGVPFVTTTTYLRHPGDTPAMHAKTKLVYMSGPMAQKLVESVMPAGQERSIDTFVEPMRTASEIIPCPREFDFDDEDWIHEGTNVSYVEPMVTRTVLGTGATPDDPTDLPSTANIIYGCAGSQVQDYETKAHDFFKNLILMMQSDGMSQYTLVLAVGAKLLAELRIEFGVDIGKSTLPTNVKLFEWVSQLEMLKRADVAFIHGGLATIKESIWEEVPIVIVPHGKDQLDNALRLSRKGMGIVAQMGETSPLDLRKFVTAALSDTRMKKSLTSMKTIFAAAEQDKPSLDVITNVVPPRS